MTDLLRVNSFDITSTVLSKEECGLIINIQDQWEDSSLSVNFNIDEKEQPYKHLCELQSSKEEFTLSLSIHDKKGNKVFGYTFFNCKVGDIFIGTFDRYNTSPIVGWCAINYTNSVKT